MLSRVQRIIQRAEDGLLALMMLSLVLLSSVQILRRLLFSDGWIDSETLGRNLVLWIAVLGALAATRERRHIAIDLFAALPDGPFRQTLQRFAFAVGAVGCAFLAWFGWGLLVLEWDSGTRLVSWLPSWLAVSVIPLGFALMALRFALQAVLPRPEAQAAA